MIEDSIHQDLISLLIFFVLVLNLILSFPLKLISSLLFLFFIFDYTQHAFFAHTAEKYRLPGQSCLGLVLTNSGDSKHNDIFLEVVRENTILDPVFKAGCNKLKKQIEFFLVVPRLLSLLKIFPDVILKIRRYENVFHRCVSQIELFLIIFGLLFQCGNQNGHLSENVGVQK